MNAEPAARWESDAAAVLRKAHRLAPDAPDNLAWSGLATTSLEGVVIPPLGTAARAPVPPPGVRGGAHGSTTGWDIRALFADCSATRVARDAMADLEGGVTSLWLTVGGDGVTLDDIPAALAGVYLESAAVVLRPTGTVDETEAATRFTKLVEQQHISPAAGTNLGADPISRGIRRRARIDAVTVGQQIGRLADIASGAGVAALVVDATTAHDLGAAEVAELGYSMALAVHYLRALVAAGLDLASSLELLEFRYTATVDQFLTIAKLRAARALWQRVTELCGLPSALPQRRASAQAAGCSAGRRRRR